MTRPETPCAPRACVALLTALTLVGCARALANEGAGGPEPTVGHGTSSLADWGLDGPDDIHFGLISWQEESDPPRFAPYRLARAEPPAPDRRVRSRRPDGDPFVVAELDHGNRNALGGFFNAFFRRPSTGAVTLGTAPERGGGLELRFDRATEGFAGAWIHLFDLSAPRSERRYLDASGFTHLTLWVRGEAGAEPATLSVQDAALEAREEAAAVGLLGSFVDAGRIGSEWARAVIPLAALPTGVDVANLASLVLEITEPARGSVWIRSVRLTTDPSRPEDPPTALPEAEPGARPHLGTWLWNTSDLMRSDRRLRTVVDWVDRAGFDEVFLQLPGLPGETGDPADAEWDDARLQEVVGAFRARGLTVSALDGFRSYALPSMHGQVLSVVDRVVRYNTSAPEHARFHGLHHDVEPYLLAGFHGPRKEGILRGYLGLIRESARRVRAVGMEYGMDIPFWYDALDEHYQEPVTVEFDGVRKPTSHHVIDLVDVLTIMDYRTTAYGADGTIRHGSGELDYASQVGRPVLIGLETVELPDETLLEFRGPPRRGMPDAWPAKGAVLAWTVGDSLRLVVTRPTGDPSASPVAPDPASLALPDDPDDVRWWPVDRAVAVPADKLTFWELGADPLRQTARETVRELSRYPAFAGLAVHYVGSLEKLRRCPGCPVIAPEELKLLEGPAH